MIVERTPNEIRLRFSPNVDRLGMKRVLDYIAYLEMTSDVKSAQKDADKLADQLNENWWKSNKDRFIE